jgi:hypothetical protein
VSWSRSLRARSFPLQTQARLTCVCEAMVEFLAPSRNTSLQRSNLGISICPRRYQHHASHPRNPNGDLALPLPEETRRHTTHHKRCRSMPFLPYTHIYSIQARTQWLRSFFSQARNSASTSRSPKNKSQWCCAREDIDTVVDR